MEARINQGNKTINGVMRAYFFSICYLQITLICVQVINKPCAREAKYMRLISWIYHRGSEQYHLSTYFTKFQ